MMSFKLLFLYKEVVFSILLLSALLVLTDEMSDTKQRDIWRASYSFVQNKVTLQGCKLNKPKLYCPILQRELQICTRTFSK